jgi:hypothetical protein
LGEGNVFAHELVSVFDSFRHGKSVVFNIESSPCPLGEPSARGGHWPKGDRVYVA